MNANIKTKIFITAGIFFTFFAAKMNNYNRIKNDLKKEVVTSYFYQGFPYSLSKPESAQVDSIIKKLYENPEVFKKTKQYYDFYTNDFLLKSSKDVSKFDSLYLENLKRFNLLSNELIKIEGVKEDFSSLFKIYSNNPEFKKNFKSEFVLKMLSKNLFEVIKNKKEHKEIIRRKNISGGFIDRYNRDINNKKINSNNKVIKRK